jgi:hypothetical protein
MNETEIDQAVAFLLPTYIENVKAERLSRKGRHPGWMDLSIEEIREHHPEVIEEIWKLIRRAVVAIGVAGFDVVKSGTWMLRPNLRVSAKQVQVVKRTRRKDEGPLIL